MKAILVFDKMPDSCDECEVRCTGYTAKEYAEKDIKRPSWCPIKPMPTKKKPLFDPNHCDIEEEIKIIHEIVGYNRCVDEIDETMGETER